MPNSLVMMDIRTDNVALELQLPLGQMQLAFGQDITTNTNTLVARMGNQFKAYLVEHIHPTSPDGKVWKVEVGDMSVSGAEQSYTGPYQELTAFINDRQREKGMVLFRQRVRTSGNPRTGYCTFSSDPNCKNATREGSEKPSRVA